MRGGRADNPYVFTTTKSYKDLPAAHRQHNHKGHCSKVHGHNWAFDIVFYAHVLDENDFVLDIGKIGFIKEWFDGFFDHTLLINKYDPKRRFYEDDPDNDVRIVENCGMEALARMAFLRIQKMLESYMANDVSQRGLRVCAVTCWEDSKNRSTWSELPAVQFTA